MNFFSDNDIADAENFTLIEQEIARFTDEIDEKEQLPILLK